MEHPNSRMKNLLDRLKQSRVIQNDNVYNSMLQVDRADFTDTLPYEDHPQYIDYNATISAPHMHAYALEYLSDYLTPNSHILDIGSGSGYL
jgi:protein-L-isoaspartate(D-aspartate) O-methyltransferase